MNRISMLRQELGEEDIFQRLLAEEQRTLYAIALSYLRTEADALEAVQEAVCKAWTKRHKLKDQQSVRPWLIRITINCCMDELRRRKRVFPAEKVKEEAAAREMQSNERMDLERAMERMKPKYRHVIILRFYQDMTMAEIASVLKKPEGTVKTWLREGLKQLRAYL
ncbi:RNA polymerase sigma factor [Paenibacillus sp. JX-17]|uniref:RNA polymerase sigma factor n=1 Tax=Paenibacillus lacisoli TaxID=3064525 RepID=A0ABT9CBS0_9BACL|nr:RNA polymerase sigma factor [Paenibacillus sp. JX-17]MDO7906707.1 RNA polymerase sigma factor [Paenibacillus sp. JX-17]